MTTTSSTPEAPAATPPAARPDRRPAPWRARWASSVLPRHLLLAGLGLCLVVVVLESSGAFRTTQFATMAYLGIAAGGLTVLTGLSGQLSLGHGAFMAVGAYTAALLLPAEGPVLPLPAVLALAVLTALAAGAVVGVAAARLHGPYVAGATLALAVAVPATAVYFDGLGGEQGLGVAVPEIPVWVRDAAYFVTGSELTSTGYVAYLGWVCLIGTYVLLANLARGRVGRLWRAVRDDEVAAELAGIHLGRARVLAFVVSTACAGLAGAVMAMAVRVTAPSGFTLTLSLVLLSAVVLGGLGSLTGALIGSALLTFLPQLVADLGVNAGLSDLRAAELAPLVYGLTLIGVTLAAPAGLTGTVRAAWRRRRQSA
ncbi:branched-chain amino acid ABC transporter permease [Streptomyces sp. JJ38]|uniref:branched-chain amino acid ABC transporter permease n=1 Tax=Streptomyces sp. JJ38 TaxID=2738128 RepID=UPI001C58C440|nr:branched-chain amino acid ABC transporter permease [Streptomyces sp. JJ38]MBW1596084.1 branched-chain amino acid ABC transporter permease [Streptomyces sp. JJ38]